MVVSNGYGSVTSSTVTLTVTALVLGALTWKRDVIYLGSREVAEIENLNNGNVSINVTLTDHLGSPRFEVRGDGSVIEQKFAPFGESLTDPTTMSKFAKDFTNHEQTDPSGLIYMQARFYVPMYHRFLSPDPARDQHFEETQSWNIYSYVQNNPVMTTDPTGMFGKELWQWAKNGLLYGRAETDAQRAAREHNDGNKYRTEKLPEKVVPGFLNENDKQHIDDANLILKEITGPDAEANLKKKNELSLELQPEASHEAVLTAQKEGTKRAKFVLTKSLPKHTMKVVKLVEKTAEHSKKETPVPENTNKKPPIKSKKDDDKP